MSHVASCKFNVTNLDVLAKVCKKMGLELVLGQTTFKWYGTWVQDYNREDAAYKLGIDPKDYGKCVHAIRIPNRPGAYEVGVVNSPDGVGYRLVMDFWAGGGGLVAAVGGNLAEGLIQEYQKELVLSSEEVQQLENEGFKETVSVDEETQDLVIEYEN